MDGAVIVGHLGDDIQIDKRQNGVGGSLGKDHLRVGLHVPFDLLGVAEIAKCVLNTKVCEMLTRDTVGTSVRAVGDDAVVPSLQPTCKNSGCGGHTGPKAGGTEAVFELGDLLFKRLHRGVVGTGIRIALGEVIFDGLLNEGGGEIARSHDSSGFLFRLHSGMDQP